MNPGNPMYGLSFGGGSLGDSAFNAYGGLSSTQNTPEVEISAEYDTFLGVRSVTVQTGTTDVTGGEFTASSGVDANGIGAIFSNRQIISSYGQGSIVYYSSRYDTPVANNRQFSGPSTASDAMGFGYNNLEFGVFYVHSGAVIIEELVISTPASGSETATIGVNGSVLTANLTSGSVQHNAHEIATQLNTQTTLYNFTQNGDTVVCRSIFAASIAVTFTFSSDGAAVAAWNIINGGTAAIRDFVAQSDWNGDKKKGLIPQNINNYCAQYNGSISLFILDKSSDTYSLVHTFSSTNSQTTPMFSVASFRLAWTVTNTGNTTDITVRGCGAAAFVEGKRTPTSPSISRGHITPLTGLSTTPINVLTIRCREVYGNKVNLGRLLPGLINAGTDSNKGAFVQICLGSVFDGDQNFAYASKENNIVEYDTTPLEVIDAGECIASETVGISTSLNLIAFNQQILPGRTLSVIMNVVSGNASTGSASVILNQEI